MALVMIDLSNRRGSIINAGHPPVLHISQGSDAFRLYKAKAPPIGIDPDGSSAMREEHFSLLTGDRLVFYSDGIFQRFDRSFDLFLNEMKHIANVPQGKLISSLLPPEEVPLDDDITLLLIDVLTATKRIPEAAGNPK